MNLLKTYKNVSKLQNILKFRLINQQQYKLYECENLFKMTHQATFIVNRGIFMPNEVKYEAYKTISKDVFLGNNKINVFVTSRSANSTSL